MPDTPSNLNPAESESVRSNYCKTSPFLRCPRHGFTPAGFHLNPVSRRTLCPDKNTIELSAPRAFCSRVNKSRDAYYYSYTSRNRFEWNKSIVPRSRFQRNEERPRGGGIFQFRETTERKTEMDFEFRGILLGENSSLCSIYSGSIINRVNICFEERNVEYGKDSSWDRIFRNCTIVLSSLTRLLWT